LEPFVFGVESAVLLLEGGEVALSGEGLLALWLECLLPGADEVFVQAEGSSGLGDGVAFFGNELDSLDLELTAVEASDFCHNGPPKSKFTLLTGCPPFVGRSSIRRLLWLVGWALGWLNLWGEERFKRLREALMRHRWRLPKGVSYLFDWIAQMLHQLLHPRPKILLPPG
jgi:hypothetical protein